MPVYFIATRTSNAVKIGWAEDVEKRLKALQTANHEELALIRKIDSEAWVETWLHNHFRERHIRGEWFRFAVEMLTIEPPKTPDIQFPVIETATQEALQKAIELAGGQANLARQIGVKQGHVWWWLNRSKKVPARYIKPICRITGQTFMEFLPFAETAA